MDVRQESARLQVEEPPVYTAARLRFPLAFNFLLMLMAALCFAPIGYFLNAWRLGPRPGPITDPRDYPWTLADLRDDAAREGQLLRFERAYRVREDWNGTHYCELRDDPGVFEWIERRRQLQRIPATSRWVTRFGETWPASWGSLEADNECAWYSMLPKYQYFEGPNYVVLHDPRRRRIYIQCEWVF